MTLDSLPDRPAWNALIAHSGAMKTRHLRDIFHADPDRGTRLRVDAVGWYFDFSKNLVTDETLALLIQLAQESGVAERRDAMFVGERINVSENRAVLHVALRMPKSARLEVDGVDVVAEVHRVLDRMATFANQVRSGVWRGH